jgi:calcium-dependent protein kinase
MGGSGDQPQASPESGTANTLQDSQSPTGATQDSVFHFNHVFTRDNAGKLEDEYEVEASKMGEGSFGSVFKAKSKTTNVERAVKSIEMRAVKNPIRFEREINIAKQLDHPNVVRLFETFRDAKKIYLVMELCTGGELFDRIVDEAPSGFDEIKAAKYIRQIVAALCYLHSQRFAHRDVKPENFLLHDKKPDAALKIIDFGLACQLEPGKLMSTKAGTAYYVAPEVLKGEYDEKCDIWSAGVIAFILLCGYPPFSGDTDPEILRKVKAGSFEFKSPEWDQISQGAKNLVTQMLTAEPGLRPNADLLLQTPWLKFKGAPESVPIKGDFLKRLQSFNNHAKLKKVALTVVAQQMQDDDIEALQNTFRTLDANGDGKLSTEEIREAMSKQGLDVPQALEDLLKSIDLDGSGMIDYTEFLAASLERKQYMQRDVCWNAFRTFDLDGDGKITRDELAKVLNGNNLQTAFSAGKIDKLISEVDKDGDGCIDFEEFWDMMQPDSSKEPASKRQRTGEDSLWRRRSSLSAETLGRV